MGKTKQCIYLYSEPLFIISLSRCQEIGDCRRGNKKTHTSTVLRVGVLKIRCLLQAVCHSRLPLAVKLTHTKNPKGELNMIRLKTKILSQTMLLCLTAVRYLNSNRILNTNDGLVSLMLRSRKETSQSFPICDQ